MVITCEHASNRLPDWITPQEADKPWLQAHWAYDRGGAAVTRATVAASGSSTGTMSFTDRVDAITTRLEDAERALQRLQG